MRNKKWVPHGHTAAPAGSRLGSGHRRGRGGVRGKWWNPPLDPSPVKELNKIIKELENK